MNITPQELADLADELCNRKELKAMGPAAQGGFKLGVQAMRGAIIRKEQDHE